MDVKTIAVIGAGTLGLCTVAAVRTLTTPHVLIAAAKHPAQAALASQLGADVVVESLQDVHVKEA